MSNPEERKPNLAVQVIIIRIAVAVFAAVMVGAVGVSLFREYGRDYFLAKNESPRPDKKVVTEWRDAVAKGDVRNAILLASRIVRDYDKVELPQLEYLMIMQGNRINSTFLTDPFNGYDFIRWRDAMQLRKMARSAIKSDKTALNDLVKLVNSKVKFRRMRKMEYPPYSVMDIIKRGYGNNRDRLRVLCNLARQAGFKVMVVGLLQPDKKIIYMFGLFSKDGKTCVADIKKGIVVEGVTLEDIGGNRQLAGHWPGPVRKAMLGKKVYLEPVEIQDYRMLNQMLARKLNESKVKGLPLMSVSPSEELAGFMSETGAKAQGNFSAYWQDPILALHSFPNVPPGWKLHKDPLPELPLTKPAATAEKPQPKPSGK